MTRYLTREERMEKISKMQTQFDHLQLMEAPNSTIEYMCSPYTNSTGFTVLMKWCLMTRLHPELIVSITQYLQSHSNEINVQNDKKWSALMLACRNLNTLSTPETVVVLISAGANVDLCLDEDVTAIELLLMDIVNDSSVSIIDSLIKAGCDINNRDANGMTPIMYAIQFSDDHDIIASYKTVHKLIDVGCDINNIDNNDWSVLTFAVRYAVNAESLKIIKKLIGLGVNANSQSKKLNTPLKIAIRNLKGDLLLSTVRILLDAGADVNIQNCVGKTALMSAVCRCDSDNESMLTVVEMLLSNTNKIPCDVNIKDSCEQTALMQTILNTCHGKQEIVQMLIDAKSDVNIVDCDGYIPVSLTIELTRNVSELANACAISEHESSCAKTMGNIFNMLINARCDVNIKNNEGWSPLMLATQNKINELSKMYIETLIKANADIHATNNDGYDVLTMAADNSKCNSSDAIVQTLLDAKCDIVSKGDNGISALTASVVNSNHRSSISTVKMLINNGADVNDTTDGVQLLSFVVLYSIQLYKLELQNYTIIENETDIRTGKYITSTIASRDAIQILLDANCNVNIKDGYGDNALHAILRTHEPRYELYGDIVDTLVAAKCDIEHRDVNGETLLMKAIDKNDAQTVKILLNAKADANGLDDNSVSTLIHSLSVSDKSKFNIQITEMLIDYFSDKNLIDNKGMTFHDYTSDHPSLSSRKPVWYPHLHWRCCESMRIEIETIMMINKMDHENILSMMPNEILFVIFQFIGYLHY